MADQGRADRHWTYNIQNIAVDCHAAGWNSHGSVPIADRPLAAAHAICSSIHVTPCNDGHVAITLAGENIYIELDQLGQVVGMSVDTKDTDRWVDAVVSKDDLVNVIRNLRSASTHVE